MVYKVDLASLTVRKLMSDGTQSHDPASALFGTDIQDRYTLTLARLTPYGPYSRLGESHHRCEHADTLRDTLYRGRRADTESILDPAPLAVRGQDVLLVVGAQLNLADECLPARDCRNNYGLLPDSNWRGAGWMVEFRISVGRP